MQSHKIPWFQATNQTIYHLVMTNVAMENPPILNR